MALTACATCGHPVPSGARFCPSCGSPVEVASGAPSEERRVVTVLFADLVGYTALAEHRDPENVKHFIESCFERLVADIETFGGRVDKLLGDAIVALFGAPVAHEDDAERAVRAGLRMQETLARFATERRALEEGPPIEMRVGINTGEVLVGTLAGTEYTAMGDVVNTASRLQSIAPPGRVLIGSATAALCSKAVDREPFGVTQIRGRDQMEQSWLVTGAAAAGTRPSRDDVPFVGRACERTLLDAAVELVRMGHSGVVSIVGEAGAGKTRLAEEIVGPLEGEAIVVRTACAPYGESGVWAPVVAGITSMFGVDPDTPVDVIRAAVEAKARDIWSLEADDAEVQRFLDVITHLLGHPSELDRLDAAGARDAIAAAVTDMMRRHAQTRMTVLWLDNLQWAEPVIREQLAVVVRTLAELPFLLVTAQRPDPDIVWPPHVDRPLVLQVPLGPLDRQDAAALVRHVVDRAEQPAQLDEREVDELVDRGGGNPLFLVELAGLAATCPTGSELPGSLRALIASRLDQLPSPQRAIIDNAAVLGSGDSIGALARFAQAMGQEFRHVDLDELVVASVIDVDGKWWRFRSDVVREVAYQTLTKRVRAQRHAGVAAILAERGYNIDDVAHHAATAAELRAELGNVDKVSPSITTHAINALLEAATAANQTGRHETAVRQASRALDLHGADSVTERKLLLARAVGELEHRSYPEAAADAQRVLEGAIAEGDRVHEGEARRTIGTLAQMQGDLAGARRELDAAVELFRGLDDRRRLADGLRARGFAEVFGGSLDAARRYLDEAMEIFHEIQDERGHAWTHQNLAWVAFQAGDYEDAEVQLAEAHERFEELGDRNGMSWAAGLQAWVSYFLRRFDEAEELALSVESSSRRWGDTWPTLMMKTLLANLRLWTGRVAEAEQLAERALNGFREINDRYGLMQALAPLNRARAALGKKADAQRGVEEAISLGKSFGELGMALQSAAGVAMHLGMAEQALSLTEQVIERNRSTGTTQREALVLLALAHCQAGDVDAALAAIEQVDTDDFPFGLAGRALVRAVAGDTECARADAEEVERARSASYFDLAVARLGGAIAADRAGDRADSRRWIELLSSLASTVGDVVFIAVAQTLREGASGDVAVDSSPLADGWRRIVDASVVG